MTRHSEGLTAQSRFVYHSHPSPLWVPPVGKKCISVWWFWDPCFSNFRFSHCLRPQRHLSGIRWKQTFKKRKSYLEWYTALLCRCSWQEWTTPPCGEEVGQHSFGVCLGHIVSETQCLVSPRGSSTALEVQHGLMDSVFSVSWLLPNAKFMHPAQILGIWVIRLGHGPELSPMNQ